MGSLKDLKTRINSVKSTQKISSAMKMVAAAKLRRAQESAEQGRPYAERMQQVVASLAGKADPSSHRHCSLVTASRTRICWWYCQLTVACVAVSTALSPARHGLRLPASSQKAKR